MNDSGNVFLIGPMGAGKTTVGRLLAPELGLEFLDADEEIEKAANASVSWIFDVEGEAGFRQREARMIERLTARRGVLLATGGGAVLNPENRRLLRERGIVVYLHVALEAQLRRRLKDANRPMLRGTNREQRLRELHAIRHPIYRELAHFQVEGKRQKARLVGQSIQRELDRFRASRGRES